LTAVAFFAAGVVALTVRMLVSLAVVLAVIAVAYFVARRRANGPKRLSSNRWSGLSKPRRMGVDKPNHRSKGNSRSGLEVVGRVGLTRGSAAVALRFGDRVVLVAAGETGQATVVAEMPAFEWDESQLVREPLEFPAQRTPGVATPDPTLGAVSRPGFVEALRTATSRRG
jgi:hypothetical protein